MLLLESVTCNIIPAYSLKPSTPINTKESILNKSKIPLLMEDLILKGRVIREDVQPTFELIRTGFHPIFELDDTGTIWLPENDQIIGIDLEGRTQKSFKSSQEQPYCIARNPKYLIVAGRNPDESNVNKIDDFFEVFDLETGEAYRIKPPAFKGFSFDPWGFMNLVPYGESVFYTSQTLDKSPGYLFELRLEDIADPKITRHWIEYPQRLNEPAVPHSVRYDGEGNLYIAVSDSWGIQPVFRQQIDSIGSEKPEMVATLANGMFFCFDVAGNLGVYSHTDDMGMKYTTVVDHSESNSSLDLSYNYDKVKFVGEETGEEVKPNPGGVFRMRLLSGELTLALCQDKNLYLFRQQS